jgi:hypothetical protein
MFGCIPRRPDITPEYFHDHWRHPHGALGRQIPTFRGYIQSHQIHSDLLGPGHRQTRFEGCAEVWFDNVHDASTLATEPQYVRHVLPDEPLFVDLPNLCWAFAREEVIVSGPDARAPLSAGDAAFRLDTRPTYVKLLQFIEVEGSTRWDAEDDAALGERIGALRHVRCRPAMELHPNGVFSVGVRELIWPTRWEMEQGVARDRAAWDALVNGPAVSTALVAHAETWI